MTLVAQTGETPYTLMLIRGIAFGPIPPELIKLPLPEIEVITDTVVEANTSAKEVRLASGAQLGYDALIVATGSESRPFTPDVIRRETALHIRELMTGLGRPARVAIYGGHRLPVGSATQLRTGLRSDRD
ncbi:hypothetical protein GCM10027416_14410 [Okibacterium endophyticum]